MARVCPTNVPMRYFENIDRDRHTPESVRDEIIEVLRTAGSVDEARTRYEAWRRGASATGVAPSLIRDFGREEKVGSLRYRRSFADIVAEMLRSDPTMGGADATDLEELISWLLGEPTTIEPAAALFLFDTILSSRPIDMRLVWLWRSERRGPDPFAGCEITCLPWRLGLPSPVPARNTCGFASSQRSWIALASPHSSTYHGNRTPIGNQTAKPNRDPTDPLNVKMTV